MDQQIQTSPGQYSPEQMDNADVPICEESIRSFPAEKTVDDPPTALSPTSRIECAEPSWWSLVLHHNAEPGRTHWLDGLVGCATDDAKYIITSPTARFVPRPFYGAIEVSLQPDGHFGSADPIHHPQFIQHESRYAWMVAIERFTSERIRQRSLWHLLDSTTHFELVKTSNVGLGVVPNDFKRFANEAVRPLGELVALFEQVHGTNPELSWLFNTMLDAVDRLAYPASFRDLARTWACVQRFSLYTRAWFDWNLNFLQTYRLPLNETSFVPLPYENWMGGITTSSTLASRLAKHNISVWLMRPAANFSGDEVIEKAVNFTEPVTCLEFSRPYQRAEHEQLFANKISSSRVAGDDHLTWINRMAVRYLDEERLPCTAVATRSTDEPQYTSADAYVAVSTSEQDNSGGTGLISSVATRFTPYPKERLPTADRSSLGKNERLKFEEFSHPLLPPSITQWQSACSSVDLTARAPTGSNVWKYMFPEARLVVTSPTARRQLRFIRNWLRLREVWLYLVSSTSYDSETVHPLRIQEWREYLYTSSATQTTDNPATSNVALQRHAKKKAKSIDHKRAVHDMFRNVFGQNVMDCPIPDSFYGRSLVVFHNDEALHIDETSARTVQIIGWELHELEFRWELMQLDETVVPYKDEDLVKRHKRQELLDAIFPARCKLRIVDLPISNTGLAAAVVSERAPYVEALRVLITRWPSVPDALIACQSMTLLPDDQFLETEIQLLNFYCQTFW
ncbi:hypothetical protein EIP86_000444, partial [Pleurotus ostreatoroseus]